MRPWQIWSAAILVCGGCAREVVERPPNVLLVSIDTLRADRLSCYGNDRETSPTIDALAREGVLFTDCQAPTSWTLPAHMTMLTGLPISVHGVCDHGLWTQTEADLEAHGTLLAEHLQRAGYSNAGFFSITFLGPRFGFGAGFHHYEGIAYSLTTLPGIGEEIEQLMEAGDEARARELVAGFVAERGTNKRADLMIDAALGWLDTRAAADDDRPFFLFVHLFDVHDPYEPPAPYDTLFAAESTAADAPYRERFGAEDLPWKIRERQLALYDGGIAWTDSQLARLVERLSALELLDETLVVVTSDHGEEFFEHGGQRHHDTLFKESVHVPLVLRWPGHLPAGLRVDAPVGLVDIVPTVLAATGAGADAAADLPGRDLAALAKTGADPPWIHVAELTRFRDDATVPEIQIALREGSDRRFLRTARDGSQNAWRFDLERDPRELYEIPIQPGTPAWSALEARLDGVRTQFREQRAHAASWPIRPEALDGDERSILEQFGYVGGAGSLASEGVEEFCFDGCVWRVP